MSFQAHLQGWHDFYLVAGGASATLVGLLFVGLSLHLRAVVLRPEVRSLARATLTNFVLVLLVALFVVIPQDARALGDDLIVSGAVSAAIVAPTLAAAARSRTRTLHVWQLLMRFGVSAAGYAAVVVAGALILNGADTAALAALGGSSIALLVVSLRNSWDLLVTVGAARMSEGRAEDAEQGHDADPGRGGLPSDA